MSNDNKTNKFKVSPWVIYVGIALLFVGINYFSGTTTWSDPKQTTISNFYKYLDKGEVQKVVYNKTTTEIFLKDSALTADPEHKNVQKDMFQKPNKGPHYVVNVGSDNELFLKKLDDASKAGKLGDYTSQPDSMWGELFMGIILPILIFVVLWLFLMRRMTGGAPGGGGQIFNIGKSRARLFDEKNDVKVTFKDVAGLEGAKEEIQEIVEFLKNPEKYTNIGGKIPKGALLVGPPGTGKTLLAKAVAGEARVPFFSLSGSDFVEMFVGVGASRGRALV